MAEALEFIKLVIEASNQKNVKEIFEILEYITKKISFEEKNKDQIELLEKLRSLTLLNREIYSFDPQLKIEILKKLKTKKNRLLYSILPRNYVN